MLFSYVYESFLHWWEHQARLIDYVDQLCSAERVISSSLHGIILAESYGIPAVLYLPEEVKGNLTLYKYRDYYYGTGRYEFPIAKTIQEALQITPCMLPDLKE